MSDQNYATYCPIRCDGNELCMGAPCAWAVHDTETKEWFCSCAVTEQTTTGRFKLNVISQGHRNKPND